MYNLKIMTIGVITTSRADYGIYLPLLKRLQVENVELLLFVSGMHLESKFGNTIDLIEEDGFKITERTKYLENDDNCMSVALAMGKSIIKYSSIWNKHADNLDLLFVLGDRFEMFSIVSSTIPFNIPLAHIHGGETTLGAIDNKFRDGITAMSDYHFTSHDIHKKRVEEIKGSNKNIFNVGALGLDAILNFKALTQKEFEIQFNFNLNEPFILFTYHPETVYLTNGSNISKVIDALKEIHEPVLCTLPNADTQGELIRNKLKEYEAKYPKRIKCVENLGQKGYLTAMKHCMLMIGNTSSGIVEAASFNKLVINVGNRQKGRVSGKNVYHVKNDKNEILQAYENSKSNKIDKFDNPFGNGNAANQIVKILFNEIL